MSPRDGKTAAYVERASLDMKRVIHSNREGVQRQAAYTSPEVMIGMLITSIKVVALHLGIILRFGIVQSAEVEIRRK